MVSLSATVARHRIFYPRPILAMPDILMIDLPAGFQARSSQGTRQEEPLVIVMLQDGDVPAV